MVPFGFPAERTGVDLEGLAHDGGPSGEAPPVSNWLLATKPDASAARPVRPATMWRIVA